ncbi:peptidase M1-like protein [Flavobacteriaceae bacterium MAR_2010_105]|nr:peptidase M1-like protein [Flavobacteriaceae bacterium MAR_2010_105]
MFNLQFIKNIIVPFVCVMSFWLHAQNSELNPVSKNSGYWQQHVDYTMEIDMDVNSYRYNGTQKLVYTNNSPDVLNRVFYHLYPNAFQPGSEMDARLHTIADPDRRMVNNLGTKEIPIYESRIAKLKPNEIGYINVTSLKQNGAVLNYKTVGTILEVELEAPIKPGEQTTFDMVFNAQVPIQIRRSGRNNKEGIALSMAQWYPKLAEYDTEGWHTNPYIAREFYGVWGDFDVKISIDKDYILGGTGYLQNPNEIGYGYETGPVNRPKGKKLTWHFKAPNVHDFSWAADPDYRHDTLQVPDGPLLHFLYKKTMSSKKLENWKNLQPKTAELIQYYSSLIGTYPYQQYSVIQAGDGGMEYNMCTFVYGEGSFKGLFYGVIAHEMAHVWFQFILANNESKHPWMDEGFATYIEYKALNELFNETASNPWEKSYSAYDYIVKSGFEQAQTTHSDAYNYNISYSVASYYKGALFLTQLGYIIGETNLDNTLKNYSSEWKFKHPSPNDFIRVAEKTSGLELDWYLMNWVQTTNTIDYGVLSIGENGDSTKIVLERNGLMPMPLDIEIELTNGTKQLLYIPLCDMRGHKPLSNETLVLKDWIWAYPSYSFTIDVQKEQIKSITIDPKGLMADVNKENNKKLLIDKSE